jgi:hypothetical protein
MTDWPLAKGVNPLAPQALVCPYCSAKNEGGFPGQLALVTKRYDESKAH